MLETPEFSEESYTVDLNDLNKSEKIAKPAAAEKFKVISVQPYEEELPQPIEQKTESLEENTNVESLNEENLLWD